MSFEFIPTYYRVNSSSASPPQFTDKTSIAPAPEGEPFYQEKQQPKHCTIHSMNIFAGREIVNVPALASVNNKYFYEIYEKGQAGIKKSQGLDLIPFLKKARLYKEETQDIETSGLGNPDIMKSYMEKNKHLFTLPPTSQIHIARNEDIEKALVAIETNPQLHRVIVKMLLHNVAFRKDETGSWRVIDSMTLSHNKQATVKLAELQPSFNSLREAIQKTLPSIAEYYKSSPENGVRAVIYPSEDYSPLTLVIAERSGLPPSVSTMIDAYL